MSILLPRSVSRSIIHFYYASHRAAAGVWDVVLFGTITEEPSSAPEEVGALDVGLFILRVLVGALFVGHGTQKLFGWFGGRGPAGTGDTMRKLGYRPHLEMAVLAGLAEAGAGSLLVVGFLTPLAAAAIVGVMINAVAAVHLKNGLWNSKGGIELPLVYAIAALALAFAGPGSYSVDSAVGLTWGGPWGLGALALGVGSGMLIAYSRRREEPASARAGSRADEESEPTERRRAA